MNPDEYAAKQALISAAIAKFVLQLARFFTVPKLSTNDWLQFLDFVFPQVEAERQKAADLARTFYDSQRSQYHPDLPRNDRFLETYDFERFVKDMDPARERLSRVDAGDDAVAQAALQAIRVVENAGRQQIIHAVENDPAPRIVKGWARVATGRETCAWCLMLVSRGPVYFGADSAGLDLGDSDAVDLISRGDDVSGFMQQWHAGCDCKVVPVFDLRNWPGKEAADKALELWNSASREAIGLEDDPGTHTHGKNKGEKFTRNQLALNALRRKLDRGEIDPASYAGIAA